jgi:hypothetical protein
VSLCRGARRCGVPWQPRGARALPLADASTAQYVADVQPGLLDSFGARAPPEVVDAMRQTIANMLGTLPPQARGLAHQPCFCVGLCSLARFQAPTLGCS